MGILLQIFSAFLLGLIGGATPGPILTASFTEALRSGSVRGLRVVFMAMIAESIVAAFVLILFFLMRIPQVVFYMLSFIGVGVLVWLAIQVWKIKEIGGEGEIFSFKKIFLLTIFNGPFLVFWITIGVPQAFLLRREIAGGHILFLILFELGWLLATTLLVFLFSRLRYLLARKKVISAAFKFLAILLLLFAVNLFITSIRFFII